MAEFSTVAVRNYSLDGRAATDVLRRHRLSGAWELVLSDAAYGDVPIAERRVPMKADDVHVWFNEAADQIISV